VARGFATDDEMDTDDDMGDFSRKAAKVAHKLIDNNSNETEIVKILYTYKDPQTGEPMIALAGVMILSQQTALWAHNTNAPNHKGREVRRIASRCITWCKSVFYRNIECVIWDTSH